MKNKIGILLENRFIDREIEYYRSRFQEEGMEVVFLTRLWGQQKLTFQGIDLGRKIDVATSFEDLSERELEDFAAVIVPAGFVADFLLYAEQPDDISPACLFLSRIMKRKDILKGFICHALWLSAPVKECFRGRKVTCHNNIISHVKNAEMVYVDQRVVVDDDLITARTGDDYMAFVNTLLDAMDYKIKRKRGKKMKAGNRTGRKRILCIVSEWGYWGEELVAPYDELTDRGYTFDFISPKGGRPVALPPSMDETYVDPPLGKHVTSAHFAKRTREVDTGNLFDGIRDLSKWFPERPYFNSPNFGHDLVTYHEKREQCWRELERYDALLLPGGSGPMVDIVNNQRVHDVILGFVAQKKLIAAECYCVTALAFARDWTERKSIIKGKHVTGHALEYDYKDGTGFAVSELNYGTPFYPLEFILRDAVGKKGEFHGGVGKPISTILDYPFLTGRSTQDSTLVGQLMYKALEKGLKRYGW